MNQTNERKMVVILFIAVMVVFSMAQRQSSKIERLYLSVKSAAAAPFASE